MSDELLFDCPRCAGPLGPDERCARCDAGEPSSLSQADTLAPLHEPAPARPSTATSPPPPGTRGVGRDPQTGQVVARPPTAEIPIPEGARMKPDDIVVTPDQVILLVVAAAVVIGLFLLMAFG